MTTNFTSLIVQLKRWANRLWPFPKPIRRGGILSYLLTVIIMAIALLARLTIDPISNGLEYVIFFPAVTLAAIVGGYGTGLFATSIGMVLATFLFDPPFYDVSLQDIKLSFWPNLIFLTSGLIISFAIEAMHRYCRQYQDELQALQKVEARERNLNSELQQLIAAQIEQKVEYQLILDTSHDGFYIVSTQNNRILDANPAACRMLGYSKTEFLQLHIIDDIETNSSPEQVQHHMHAVMQGQQTHFETKHRHRDGHLVAVDISAQYLNARGGIIVVFSRDITEQKRLKLAMQQSEMRFRHLFENMRSGAVVYEAVDDGQDFIFRDINTAAEKIDALHREQLIGRRLTEAFP